MKRLAIFFFYEKNGIVDDFICYYLADLIRNVTELEIVCNGQRKQGPGCMGLQDDPGFLRMGTSAGI